MRCIIPVRKIIIDVNNLIILGNTNECLKLNPIEKKIKGLGFKDKRTAALSVAKIKRSNRTHAHKTQAAIAMEQRAKVAKKTGAAGVYRKFIEEQKKKTKMKNK